LTKNAFISCKGVNAFFDSVGVPSGFAHRAARYSAKKKTGEIFSPVFLIDARILHQDAAIFKIGARYE
jgi:hypothetical protein